MDEEYTPHRKALEDGGWLMDGEIIHYWVRMKDYPVSFYVVAFKSHTGTITVNCIRGFGGNTEIPAQVSIDKRIGNWERIFGKE